MTFINSFEKEFFDNFITQIDETTNEVIIHNNVESFRVSHIFLKEENTILVFVTDLFDETDIIEDQMNKILGDLKKYETTKNDYEMIEQSVWGIQKYLPPRISLIGFKGVGKTKIANLLKADEIPVENDPKLSGDIITCKVGHFYFQIWDFNGEDSIRFLWINFIRNCNAIILITDSEIENAKKSRYFLDLIKEENSHKLVLVIANKQDLIKSIKATQVEEILLLKTVPLNATSLSARSNFLNIIIDLFNIQDIISPILTKINHRNFLLKNLELQIKNSNFSEANFVFNKIINLCIDLGDDPSKLAFYQNRDIINSAITADDDKKQDYLDEKKISIKESQLKILLKNLLYEVEGIIALSISDRAGFIITSESKLEKQDDEILVAVAGSLDMYIDRLKKEFGSNGNFFNITNLSDQKLSYCSMGPNSILTALSAPSTSDTELKVYCEHIANKIELILEGQENVSLDIPDLIKILSKMKSGIIPKGEYSSKIILTGDFKVGKTSLVRRFVQNLFLDRYISTIGVNISKKKINLTEDTKIDFAIWDLGGQNFSMTPYRKRFYEGAGGAFIVVDRTRPDNLLSIDTWYEDIKKSTPSNIPIVIVGNKSDLKKDIVISEEDIETIAKRYGFHYILTSAKSGENVQESFLYIAYRFIENN